MTRGGITRRKVDGGEQKGRERGKEEVKEEVKEGGSGGGRKGGRHVYLYNFTQFGFAQYFSHTETMRLAISQE